jgi:hypothetical protein
MSEIVINVVDGLRVMDGKRIPRIRFTSLDTAMPFLNLWILISYKDIVGFQVTSSVVSEDTPRLPTFQYSDSLSHVGDTPSNQWRFDLANVCSFELNSHTHCDDDHSKFH